MFHVVWLQPALNELAAAWIQANSTERQTITAATHTIDQLLKTDPHNQGESRPHGQRIMFLSPLGMTFEIRQEMVRILHIWMVRRRGQQ